MLGRRKAVNFTRTMLDAGYLMLGIAKFAESEIQKHPVSRNQYPGSLNIANGLHHNGFNIRKYFRQLRGQLRSKWENCMVKVPRPWVADRREVEYPNMLDRGTVTLII